MKNTALVISSGGARGLAAIGVIEEMERQGYVISSIAGCSIGSLIGGMYASGNLNKFKSWILKLDKRDVFKLMDFTFSSRGILKGKKVFEELKKIIGDVNIEDFKDVDVVCDLNGIPNDPASELNKKLTWKIN